MKTQNYNSYYSIKEFASLIKVHENTVRRSIKSGRINAFRVGSGKKSMYRIPLSEINKMAEIDFDKVLNEIIEQKRQNI